MAGKKRIIVVFLVFSFFINFTATVWAKIDLDVHTAFLMEASSGQILYQKNAGQALPPASITKTMTLLLIFEALERGDLAWDEIVTVSEEAWRMQGSQMFLEIGQQVSVKDLVSGISIISGNDACVAIAEHLYGSEAAFVQVMNKRAGELGLKNSKFQNSTGWPAKDHYMSAEDIANLARYLINTYPGIIEFESQKEFTFNNIRQFNRNSLLGRYPGADGLKTGWTVEAGHCLVGTAQREDIRMIAVLLNATDEGSRLIAAQKLLDYGFLGFEPFPVARGGEVIGEIDILDGKKKTLQVTVGRDFTAFVPTGTKEETLILLIGQPDLKAPVESGEVVGILEIQSAGEKIVSTEIIAQTGMKKANFLVRFFRKIYELIF